MLQAIARFCENITGLILIGFLAFGDLDCDFCESKDVISLIFDTNDWNHSYGISFYIVSCVSLFIWVLLLPVYYKLYAHKFEF